MANEYKTIITNTGSAKIAEAIASGIPLRVQAAAVGDGNGADYTPDPAQTALRREVWRGPIVHSEIDPAEPKMVNVRFVIPPEDGGFTVREAGLFDEAGAMLAACNLPATKKEIYTSGTTGKLTIIMHIVVTDAGALEVVIRPDLDMVTHEQMQEAVSGAVAGHNADASSHGDIRKAITDVVEALPSDYYKKAQTDQQIGTAVSTHNLSVNAHGDVRAGVVALESRVKNIETIIGGGISTNPFSVTFTSLAGVSVAGVWNNTQGRIEF